MTDKHDAAMEHRKVDEKALSQGYQIIAPSISYGLYRAAVRAYESSRTAPATAENYVKYGLGQQDVMAGGGVPTARSGQVDNPPPSAPDDADIYCSDCDTITYCPHKFARNARRLRSASDKDPPDDIDLTGDAYAKGYADGYKAKALSCAPDRELIIEAMAKAIEASGRQKAWLIPSSITKDTAIVAYDAMLKIMGETK